MDQTITKPVPCMQEVVAKIADTSRKVWIGSGEDMKQDVSVLSEVSYNS